MLALSMTAAAMTHAAVTMAAAVTGVTVAAATGATVAAATGATVDAATEAATAATVGTAVHVDSDVIFHDDEVESISATMMRMKILMNDVQGILNGPKFKI